MAGIKSAAWALAARLFPDAPFLVLIETTTREATTEGTLARENADVVRFV